MFGEESSVRMLNGQIESPEVAAVLVGRGFGRAVDYPEVNPVGV